MKIVVIITVYLSTLVLGEDLPCVPKKLTQDSFVCVCNSSYCDTIERVENSGPGTYILYSSNKESLRFNSTSGNLYSIDGSENSNTWAWDESNDIKFKIDVTHKYQNIFGFGGSVTDATCLNYLKLQSTTRQRIISTYFGPDGLEYNMLRVPIGGTDFSTHTYAYNELPIDDKLLTNFTLAPEDHNLKIPFIKKALKEATDEIFIVSAAWSPPIWMKSNEDYGGYSMLLPEYYQTWALYHIKFLEEYKKENINIWALSTGNEPTTSLIPLVAINSLGWTPAKQADWISNNLGPLLRSSAFSNVKLLAVDDQRFNLPFWLNQMQAHNNKTMTYIDGIAVHFYWDRFIPISVLDVTLKEYPDKFFLGTEACTGSNPWEYPKVALGSWSRAELYITDIITNLNHGYRGWIDWNLVLDEQGGPNWYRNFVDAPIIVMPDSDEFYKQPLFYAMGHFSKFIPRDSTRVKVITSVDVPHVAFVTPSAQIVVVLYNKKHSDLQVTISIGNEELSVMLTGQSINTVKIWPSTSSSDSA